MRRVRFDGNALQEFEEAVEYHLARSPEAASRFVDAFEGAIDLIRENPQVAVRIEGDVRRWKLHRFPYSLIYRTVEDCIVIIAVMHGRREPGYWKSRLR